MSRSLGCSLLVRWLALVMFVSSSLTMAEDPGCFKKEGNDVVYDGRCTQSEYKVPLVEKAFSIEFKFDGTKVVDTFAYNMSVSGCSFKLQVGDYPVPGDRIPKIEILSVTSFELPTNLSVNSSVYSMQDKTRSVSLGTICSNSPVFTNAADGKFETTVSIKTTSGGQLPTFKITIKDPKNPTTGADSESKDLTPLWIGLGVGIPVLLLVLSSIVGGIIAFIIVRRRKKAKSDANTAEQGENSKKGDATKSVATSVAGSVKKESGSPAQDPGYETVQNTNQNEDEIDEVDENQPIPTERPQTMKDAVLWNREILLRTPKNHISFYARDDPMAPADFEKFKCRLDNERKKLEKMEKAGKQTKELKEQRKYVERMVLVEKEVARAAKKN